LATAAEPIQGRDDPGGLLLAASYWRRAPGPARGDGGEQSLGAVGVSGAWGDWRGRVAGDRDKDRSRSRESIQTKRMDEGRTTGTGTTAAAREKLARKLQTVREKP
jgi:hypothetical protein